MKNIEIKKEIINALCKKHNVKNLYIFGSVLNENFNNESDIDLLVKFLPIELHDYFNNYLNLKENLREIFGREIDLVEEQTLRNPILINSINRTKQLIYG